MQKSGVHRLSARGSRPLPSWSGSARTDGEEMSFHAKPDLPTESGKRLAQTNTASAGRLRSSANFGSSFSDLNSRTRFSPGKGMVEWRQARQCTLTLTNAIRSPTVWSVSASRSEISMLNSSSSDMIVSTISRLVRDPHRDLQLLKCSPGWPVVV
jgi:hypothetical protein